MARKRYVRRTGGKADGGAAWISYSDMMAALLLVFVLVLCYSVYQYFLMLETKTAELDEQGALLSAQQSTLDEQKATLDKQQQELTTQQAALTAKQDELTSALTQLDEKQSLLNDQSLTLEEQEKIILAAQAALTQKEAELTAANTELETKQQELANATILLGQQQAAMDTQQQRLDDLVGVRTKIVKELTAALRQADLKASVDSNTGDIMLESAVFFDVAKSSIKESGRALLDEFIPVYLGVLLQPEYQDYLGEIIIEGHTDTQGAYLVNLELSQQRALSVATYCLQMPGLSEKQLSKLRDILTAKGRSYSDPIYNSDGTINMDASRRVEFKFRMKDSEMIDEIRGILGSGNE
ncbi:MAG: OmpA family protein [Clostridiales bacterium]|nr:OmpA family protein [Clostridiales bacterium]MDO4350486.1 OmpA family protein [Eubacteriales bacterium]MDY4009302.1 OmpA family protein [Candidatus Limiplasma sp.]